MMEDEFNISLQVLQPDLQEVLLALTSKFYSKIKSYDRNFGAGTYYGFIRASEVQDQITKYSKWQVRSRLEKLHKLGMVEKNIRTGHLTKVSYDFRPAYFHGVEPDPLKPENIIIN
jgi:hypothetical protein